MRSAGSDRRFLSQSAVFGDALAVSNGHKVCFSAKSRKKRASSDQKHLKKKTIKIKTFFFQKSETTKMPLNLRVNLENHDVF